MELQTLAGLPKALSAQINALLGNMPGIRECAKDASTLVDHAQALFDDITNDIAEATFDKAATLVEQARTTVQQTTPAVSQLAAATITRSW